MHNPMITVIIPVYNSAVDLPRCLDSVLTQSYHNLEIILIDDGSTDKSGAICDAYAEIDNRIICVHQENKGVSCARNLGIELGTGDFYHFLDSDDYINQNAYEKMMNIIHEFSVQAVVFEYYTTFKDYEVVHQLNHGVYGVRDTQGSIHGLLFEGNSFLCTKLLPSYVVKQLRFCEDIYRDEDTLFAMLAMMNLSSSYYYDCPLLHYVQSEESATRGRFRRSQLSAVKVIPIMEQLMIESFPQWLNKWRENYMHLMIMLYMDMYFDQCSFLEEQKMIYTEFMSLYRKVGLSQIIGMKNKTKFLLFRISPKLFAITHKIIHRI